MPQVGRLAIGEGSLVLIRISHQQESGVIGRLPKLVEIQRQAVGELYALETGREFRGEDSQGAQRAIDVKGRALTRGDFRQTLKVVEGADIHGPGRTHYQERFDPTGAIGVDGLLKRREADSPVGVAIDKAKSRRAQPGHVHRADHARMHALGRIGGDRRISHAADADLIPQGLVPGDQHRAEICRGGAGQEDAARVGREAEQLRHPSDDLALNLNGHVVAPAQIGVETAGQHLGQHADGCTAALHPAHEAGMAVAGAIGSDVGHELGVRLRQRRTRPRQTRPVPRARLRGERPPNRPLTDSFQTIEHVVEHAVALHAHLRPVLWIEILGSRGVVHGRSGSERLAYAAFASP